MTTATVAHGYTTSRLGPHRRWREYVRLLQVHRHPEVDVEAMASTLVRARERIEAELGTTMRDLRVIDVGSGQRRIAASVFAIDNAALAIDAELVPVRLTPRSMWRLSTAEGSVRTFKTVGRRVLGFDRRFRRMLCARLGLAGLAQPELGCMDAQRLGLGDDSVDVVFSRCLFEHLPDPAAATLELARVLRPGGVLFVALNPFTGPLGAHDPDVMSRAVPPDWAHVQRRPARASNSNAYLNRWPLADYEAMFRRLLPGCSVETWWPEDGDLELQLRNLQRAGELDGFHTEELLAREVVVVWRKGASQPGEGVT